MKRCNRIIYAALMLLYCAAGHAAMDRSLVFERVATVYDNDSYFKSIHVDSGRQFTLTLTDFAFPNELNAVGVTLISSTDVLASIVFEKPASEMPFGGAGNSWGSDYKQRSVSGYLEAGTYYLSMFAEFNPDWHAYSGMQYGLYGVEMIATPVPASLLFLLSGFGVLRYLGRRKKQ